MYRFSVLVLLLVLVLGACAAPAPAQVEDSPQQPVVTVYKPPT